MKLAPQSNWMNDTVDFWVTDDASGKHCIGKPVVMEESDGIICPPTFQIRTSDAQELFERLWALGFRSKHDRGNSDALDAARKEHISDLRRAAKLDRGTQA